jgi:hypothetical protein
MPAKPKTLIIPGEVTNILPEAHPPSTGPMSKEALENPAAPGQREEIREITRRVMGSRQSGRKVERSNSRRQPKRGHGSQRRTAE